MLDLQGFQFEASQAAPIHGYEAGLIVARLAQPWQKVPPETRPKDSHPTLLHMNRRPVSMPMAACAAAAAVAGVAASSDYCPTASLHAHLKDQEKFVAPLLPKHGSLAADVELLAFGTEFGFVQHQATASSAAIGRWKYEVSDSPPKANLCCQDHLHVTSALKPRPYVCG